MTRLAKLRFRVKYSLIASARNRAHGYQWGPVQRYRCCGHTTPYHAKDCR